MVCKEIKTGSALSLLKEAEGSSLNPPLNLAPKETPPTAYLCDSPDERPLLAQNQKNTFSDSFSLATPPSLFSAPLGGSLQKSVSFFAPSAALPASLPPPPSSPLARTLYDLTTQLQDFELTTTLKLPMEGINDYGPVQTFTKAVIKDHGALVNLGIEFRPFAGPISLLKPLDQVPVLGPFFNTRVLKVEMDPTTRRLKARVKYLFFPITKDVHDDYMKRAQLPPALMQGPGYDLHKALPVYSWQIFDLVLKILQDQSQGQKVAKNVGIDTVKPIFEKSEILMEGNFSNQSVRLGDFQLNFGPLAANEKHRIRVTGSLYEPVVTVNGLKGVELSGPAGRMRLANAEDKLPPLTIRIHVDPLHQKPTTFEIPEYQSKKVQIESLPNNGVVANPVKVEMAEGIEMKGLLFRYDQDGPHLDIQRLAIKQMTFQGMGIQLKTTSGDRAILEDIHMKVAGGRPEFVSKITTKATGDLSLTQGNQEVAFLRFQSLEGSGTLKVGDDSSGKFRLEVVGNITTQIPEMKFRVQSEKIKASVQIKLEETTVGGVGRLTVWPDTLQATLESIEKGKTISVKGKGGLVTFHQDPSQVEAWPELKKQLGDLNAQKVVTDFFVKPKSIEFNIDKMSLKSIVPAPGNPSLEIGEADIRQIDIKGDAWGKIFTRLPGGVYFPIFIPEKAIMKDAELQVGRLLDRTGKNGERSALFDSIILKGEESEATFSAKDQKRCGIDRQHIHATLGLFQFTENREVKIEKVDPHFHVYLKNHIGGGCLKIE